MVGRSLIRAMKMGVRASRSSPSWAARAGALAIGLLFGIEGGAQADEPLALRIEYRAPASCPDEAALVSRIRARVDVRPARPGETVPTFAVTVQADRDRVVGRIASMNERSEATGREVTGTDCADVIDAAALIVAMGLSPQTSGSAPTRTESFAPAATGVMTENAGASGRAPTSPAEAPTAKSGSSAHLRLLGSGQAEATFGYWPSPLVAVGARLQVIRTRAYASGPSIAVGFAAAQPVERDLLMGHARLALTTGELFVCPLSVDLAPSLNLRPCARFDLGQLKAEGSGIPGAHGKELVFSSAGVLGQVSFVPVEPLVVDAQASVLVPLTPYEFKFDPDSIIYRAPFLGLSASLAMGVMFF